MIFKLSSKIKLHWYVFVNLFPISVYFVIVVDALQLEKFYVFLIYIGFFLFVIVCLRLLQIWSNLLC